MAVTIAAVLLSSGRPRPVQVTLTGVGAGVAYEVTGSTADGGRWPVSGGRGVSTGSQILLVDNRTALNAPITYEAVVGGVTYRAVTVVVDYDGVAVVQTIDGLTVVGVEVASLTESRTAATRSSTFEIAGRADPAARLDVPGSFSYSWLLDTQGADSLTLERILRTGRPIVRRLVPGMRDLRPVVIGIVSSWSDELISDGLDTWRRWSLKVREIADPQPSTALTAFTWVDFDAAMADRVWSYHSLFAALTGWSASGGDLSLVTSGGYLTPNFARAKASAAGNVVTIIESSFAAAAGTLGAPVAAGGTYTVTARVKGTPGRTVTPLLKWSTKDVATGSPVTLTGSWQQVSVTATAPSGATGLAAGVRMEATDVASGDLLDLSAPTISAGTVVPVGSFDELFSTWDQFDAADWSLL